MKNYTVEEQGPELCARNIKIKVAGVGGGGGNMINHMITVYELDASVDLIVANTDVQDLDKSKAKTRIQIGAKKTKGLGAGMDPEAGEAAAVESKEELKDALSNSDIVFVAAGLGGGTGTGAAPIIASAAKEGGAQVVSVVTLPFEFEGSERMELALRGLEELKKESDSVIVIHNDKLMDTLSSAASLAEAYSVVDDILSNAVRGMVMILLEKGHINIDFADIRTILGYKGLALMGIGTSEGGDNAILDAFEAAIESPLLEGNGIERAKGLVVYVKGNRDRMSFKSFSTGMSQIRGRAKNVGKVIIGNGGDDSMGDRVEITIIATGFEAPSTASEQPAQTQKVRRVSNSSFEFSLDDASGIGGTDYDIPTHKRKRSRD